MVQRKWFTLLLAALLALSLVACGGAGQTTATTTQAAATTAAAAQATTAAAAAEAEGDGGEADADDHMVISIAVWDIGNAFPNDEVDPMKQMFYDMFNITIDPMAITWGDASERYQVWASSDSMPDVAGGLAIVGSGQYYQWIEDGVVRAIPDDLSAYPHVEGFMRLGEVTAYQMDGKDYILPRMTYNDPRYWCMDRGVYYRKDWLANVGLELPQSTEEFINMLIAFTEQDPDGNGVKDTVGLTTADFYFFSQIFANFGPHGSFWINMDGQWVNAMAEPVNIDLLDMIRTAYKAGAVDPDFAAHVGSDPADEMFASGRSGVHIRQMSPKHANTRLRQWKDFQSDLDFFECVGFLPMWDIPGKEMTMFAERAYWSETYISSYVDDDKCARILSIYDWMYSDEGMRFMAFGFEGEDYEYDADGQIVRLLPMKESGNMMGLNEKYPFASGMPSLACWTGDMIQYDDPSIDPQILEMCIAERDYRLANWKVPAIDWEVAAINVPEKQETTYQLSQLYNVIIMDDSDTPTADLWESYMKVELEAGGYYRMIDAVNAAAREMGK